MAMNTRGLGKGIDALFGNSAVAPTTAAPAAQETPLQYVPLDSITPSQDQPRNVFNEEALNDLAASIKSYGILEPLLVRQGESAGLYRLIAGERRLRAARLAGLTEVPVIIRDLNDQEALIITLLENLQRENLNPIEEAKGIETLRNSFNLSLEAIAETLGKARATISHNLRLLKLPEEVQKEVADGRISPSHAKALVGLTDREALLQLVKRIEEKGMTWRETGEAVAAWNETGAFPFEMEITEKQEGKRGKEAKDNPPKREIDPGFGKLADNLGKLFQCRTKIRGTQEKGKLSVTWESNEQLSALLNKLGLSLESAQE